MIEDGKTRNYLGMPQALLLDHWALMLAGVFGGHGFGWPVAYLVGSATVRRDYRDVDVRVVLDDPEFDSWFPTMRGTSNGSVDARWSAICTAFSIWGKHVTGLAIDFQVQRRSAVSESDWEKPRIPLGLYVEHK